MFLAVEYFMAWLWYAAMLLVGVVGMLQSVLRNILPAVLYCAGML